MIVGIENVQQSSRDRIVNLRGFELGSPERMVCTLARRLFDLSNIYPLRKMKFA